MSGKDEDRNVQSEEHGDTPKASAGQALTSSTEKQNLPLLVVERGSALTEVRTSMPWRALRVARFIPLLMLVMAAGGIVGLYFQPPGLQKIFSVLGLTPGGGTSSPIAVPTKSKANTAPVVSKDRPVTGLGKLLPIGEVITIAPPFGAADARIASIKVKEGERVRKRQILAVLDNEKQLLAALETSRAAVATRQATLAQVRAATQASREEAKAALQRAEATARNAQLEFDRSESLRKRGFVAEQAYQQRKTTLDQAKRDIDRARATLSRYGSGTINKQTDVVVAARNLDSARTDFDRAKIDLDKAYVRAPADATVLTIVSRPGEKPGAQGIMNIGDIDRMKIDVEVYQTEIKRVMLGDKVVAQAASLPSELRGAVTKIGLEVGKQTLVDASPAANTDARVVKVSVTLDATSSKVARPFTNLQVIAQITAGAGK